MRRSTIGLSLSTLLMAGISCNRDEIAAPTDPATSEAVASQAVGSSLTFLQVSAGYRQLRRPQLWGHHRPSDLLLGIQQLG